MRLQKYISHSGFCSRRHAEKYILAGKVKVNGVVITQLGTKVDPEKDYVEIDNTALSLVQKKVYLVLNKPEGYVTSSSHPGEKTVMELIDTNQRVFPVGRLDKDSKGLLLLTNDGELHLRLTHPSYDHEKEYMVTVAHPIPDGALKAFGEGLVILGTKTRPAKVKRISGRRFKIVLKEGRNRQIRRMVRKVGNRVVELKRVRVANIRLGKLREGHWRYLSEIEKKHLL